MGKKNKKKNEPGPSGGGGGDTPAAEKPKQQKPPKQDQPKTDAKADPPKQGGKGKKQAKGEQQHGDTAQQAQQHQPKGEQSHQQRQQKGKKNQQLEQQSEPQQSQRGSSQQQQPQQVPPQEQQTQRGHQQQQQQQQPQRGPQQLQQQQPQQQQPQRGPQQQQQPQRGPQQQQQQQQPQWGPPPQQQQWGPPQQQQQPQRGPPQQQQMQWGPPQQQQQWGPPQQQPPQWGPQQQQPPHWGPQQQQQPQRGPPQQQQWGPQQQQQPPRGPPQQQQQQQRGPPQQQQPQQAPQGPPQQQQPQEQPGQPQKQGKSKGQKQPRESDDQQKGQKGRRQEHKDSASSSTASTRDSTPRMKESPSVQSISSAISDISIKSDSSISSHHGKKGRAMTMETNYVELKISDKLKEAYHYDVSIDPDKPKRLLRLAFKVFAQTKFPRIQLAYDGRANCYSPQKLTEHIGKPVEVVVEDVEFQQKKTYKVTIKETDPLVVDLASLQNYRNSRVFDKPMRAIQCLDVVLQQPCVEKSKQGGRSFYKKPDRFIDLEDGYELYLGLFQSMVLGDTPLLNIDVSHKAFPIGESLLDYMDRMRFDLRRELDNFSVRKLDEYLKTLRLTYVPPKEDISTGKDYTFNQVKQAAYKETFSYNGQTMTIADYYQKIKQFKLKYPHLPCLWVGGKTKQILLPIELCYLRDGQVTNKKAGTKQVRAMIKYAATSTVDRKKRIMDLFRYFSHMTHPCVTAFGLRLGSEFITVDARVINAPDILYSNRRSVRVNKGSWNNQNMQFIQPVTNIKWAILYTDPNDKFSLSKLVSQTKSTARSLNMVLADTHTEELCRDERSQKAFLDKCKKENVSLVFVILNRDRNCYSNIKLFAETEVGILTQCIKGETLQKRLNQSTISNILLKVNTKLNGQNHKIEPQSEVQMLLDPKNLIMFVGADVTHPSPEQTRIPSVVGVVSSYNETFSQYFKTFRLQNPKEEMIQDMCMILQEHLLYFQKKRGKLPNKIIYYRDGVSDGQFEQLRKIELNAMDQACAKINRQYKPQITCIVVQKRHHTRFFPNATDPAIRADRYLNAPPGTIVDKKITHPKEFQFFLVSHESIQGTAKPTKYCVIRDDSKIDVDDMQAMTYNSCHLFARCNRAVSYPTPAYYAHLAAARGRVYIENNRNLDMRNLGRTYDRLMSRREFFQQYPTFFI